MRKSILSGDAHIMTCSSTLAAALLARSPIPLLTKCYLRIVSLTFKLISLKSMRKSLLSGDAHIMYCSLIDCAASESPGYMLELG